MVYKVKQSSILLLILFIISSTCSLYGKGKKPLTFADVMKFKSITSAKISDDGKYACYTAAPDRGDPNIVVQSIAADSVQFVVQRAEKPVISPNSEWVIYSIPPKQWESENADLNKPKKGMGILNTGTGKIVKFDNIEKFILSNDGKWLAYKYYDMNPPKPEQSKNKILGTELILRQLQSGSELTFPGVIEFDFDSLSKNFAYIIYEEPSVRNGVYALDLTGGYLLPQRISTIDSGMYSNITWSTKYSDLAYISAVKKKDGEPDSCSINTWNPYSKINNVIISADSLSKEWKIPFKNELRWTKDNGRLFFGLKPLKDTSAKKNEVKYNDTTFFNIDTILKKTELDLWHWNDPRIKTNQKKWYEYNKDKTWLAVYHFDLKTFIPLTDENVKDVEFAENPFYTIGYDEKPYLVESTWEGDVPTDLYSINLRTGDKKKLVSKLHEKAYISPLGKYVLYFKDKAWLLYDNRLDTLVNLTAELKFNFYNDEFDMPTEAPSYGIAGWMENDEAVLIYDKYDIWRFFTIMGYSYVNQTAADGRFNDLRFRVVDLEPDKEYYKKTDVLWVQGFHKKQKYQGLYRVTFDMLGLEKLAQEDCRFTYIAKSKNSNVILYSKQKYDMFPDLWAADSMFTESKKISDVNPQMNDFLWGKAELINWVSGYGDTLMGYYIKPDDFTEGKRYPVLVYYYEKLSDDFNTFYPVRNNHRPCYPLYAGDDYIILVTDIKYKTGTPGDDAYNCVVPAVRKLIDMGVADSTAIGIQGHSWGGYQTAYLITKTNLFAAACAGAPVGNMTSAYSGIRLESGLARQFQYEREQSRIGGNLWDSLDAYIRNSPVFQAQKIQTPLLIEFGDIDNAVPWQQGIELFLAMRRLSKNCIMLQYRNEPHILQKYQNKLDYAIRMKEFFDTYLKKKPAPDWIIKGIEYKGN
ncbi:MAG: S9 family peptidase [Bacteroidetes bacterium]|nr:MAG: S9 family peptidase [Bacteroidota bacterium]